LYQDRFYLNNGEGKFLKATGILPQIRYSSSRVIPCDYDKDGDIDLFVGGRQFPGRYPEPTSSYLIKNTFIENQKPGFVDATETTAPELKNLGMVTDAVWTDFDNDEDLDLVISGVWMPITVFINESGVFMNRTEELGLSETTGWWFSVSLSDLDNDGDEDFVFGNLGLNYKYKASKEEPFTVHLDDFDDNGTKDIVLGYYNFGGHFPVRGRSCSSDAVPCLEDSFPTYDLFARSDIYAIYGKQALENSLSYQAKMFSSVCMENKGNKGFSLHPLPNKAQFCNINDIVIHDINKDGNKDLIVAGGLYNAEVETERNDSSIGLLLFGDGAFGFDPVPLSESGLFLPYDVKEMKIIDYQGGKAILVAINNDIMKMIRINEESVR